ncbi:MAG: 5-formyltetrahydrofolate cyclo-ligase [Devosiaceae bacterium]|nr:5-formyltetrahydrofolate cyclo-ligase [Devosiaceae bacterium]
MKKIINKSELRNEAKAKRAALSSNFMLQAANQAAEIFLQNIPLEKVNVIAAYYAMNNELKILPLVEKLWAKNKQICLPSVIENNQPMIFRAWQRGDELIDGAHNIKVPDENAPILVPDIIIMPLVAFDKKGNRLGYGKGYYDRTIAQMDKKPLLVGYAYSVQEVEKIEHESHDVPLDYLVSEKEVRKF